MDGNGANGVLSCDVIACPMGLGVGMGVLKPQDIDVFRVRTNRLCGKSNVVVWLRSVQSSKLESI